MKVLSQISTKCHYSWLSREKSCSIRNTTFSNSLNIISAITTKGDSINLLKYQTTKLKNIVDFIRVLLEFIKLKYEVEIDKVGIILDNCQTHRAKELKVFSWKNSLKLYFIPVYSPELAPIETYFSLLKSFAIKEANHSLINLKSNKGMKTIMKAIQKIDSRYIKSLWMGYMNTLSIWLDQIETKVSLQHLWSDN